MKKVNYLFVLLLLTMAACVNEPLLHESFDKPSDSFDKMPSTRSGLTSNSSGYYLASQRVPLVGEGRLINDFSSALVQVINLNQGLGNLVDLDLSNSASFQGVADVSLIANQIASVRDINLTYAGGQEAGFAYKVKNESLLSLDVLKGFWIATYLDGEHQETKGGKLDVEVLQLNLISFVGGGGSERTVTISTEFDKPFDEIKIGMRGISAEVLQSLELYYAFVGENPKIPLIKGSERFPDVAVGAKNLLSTGELIDSNFSNGPLFNTVLAIGPQYATINLNKTVPIGTEIGFVVSSASLLELGLGSTYVLTTYDKNGNELEKVSTTNVLELGLIKGSSERLVSMVVQKECSQVRFTSSGILSLNLGSSTLHYAYVRDETQVDVSSYYSLSDATIYESAYRFHAPKEGNVTFNVVSSPQGAIPLVSGRTVSNISLPGEYVFDYSYSKDGETIHRQVKITKLDSDITDGCNHIINTADYPSATLYSPNGGGALIGLELGGSSNMIDGSNLIDNNPYNYVDYTNTLTLIGSTPIVAVDVGEMLNTKNETIRAGFTFQTANNFLGLNALKFFTIKLYQGDVKVYDAIANDNSSIGLTLLGTQSDKIRFGVTTDLSFDRIELWTAGLLNLNLNKFRLYNAYWEPSATCVNLGSPEACLDIISQSSHGARINYDKTGPIGTATVGTNYLNLGNILDTDKESYGEITSTNVLSATSLSVQFDELPAGQVIGFILKKPAGLADVDLIHGITLEAFLNGVSVGKSTTGGLLGLDVISSGGYTYLQFTPNSNFDEVRMLFTGVVSALKQTQIYGLFTRVDSNGDGIPDCAENPEDSDGVVSAEVVNNHLCEGEPIEIRMSEGGVPNRTYNLIYYNYAKDNKYGELEATLISNSFIIPNMPAGDYYFAIMSSANDHALYSGLHVTIHPKETAWKVDTQSDDWSTWSNWTNGTPWTCTNVIIQKGASIYPTINNTSEAYCNFIHFEPQTEVGNIHLLNYSRAWVDTELKANQYHLVGAPLKSMVTGDFFIPQALKGVHSGKLFTTLTSENTPENRFNPRIYQRVWNKSVQRKLISGGTKEVNISEGNWSQPFNALAQPYALGTGFSVWVDNQSLPESQDFVFRFPKTHSSYQYVTDDNANTGISEQIGRTFVGRFITENEESKTRLPLKVTLTNKEASDLFLVSNPFMTHLNIEEFLQENPSITSIKSYDGNITKTRNAKNNLSTFNQTHIAPMQSFFIELNAPKLNTEISFNSNMLQTRFSRTQNRVLTRNSSSGIESGLLQLTASTSKHSHQILLMQKDNASNDYIKGEDSELLYDGGVVPILSIFSNISNKALDINQFKDIEDISIGFYAKNPTDITLKANIGSVWDSWVLIDIVSQKEYSMNHLKRGISIKEVSTISERFRLEKREKK